MKLFTAMVLSSQSQAETYVIEERGLGISLNPVKRYRLVASHYPAMKPEQEKDTFTLNIYRVTYPDAAPGQGRGEPNIAEQAHKTCQFTGLEAFLDYLENADMSDQIWQPIEDEDIK